MKARRAIAQCLLCTFGLGAPSAAWAQEIRVTSPIASVTHFSPVEASVAARDALVRAPMPLRAPLSDPMQEVRLSKGAKTAIIVGAIVVGVLLIVGVVVLAKPGKKPL